MMGEVVNTKTLRFKSSHGVIATWRIGASARGGFRVLSLSKPKVGGNPLPLDFVPFEMSNMVMNSPLFNSIAECERYVRSA